MAELCSKLPESTRKNNYYKYSKSVISLCAVWLTGLVCWLGRDFINAQKHSGLTICYYLRLITAYYGWLLLITAVLNRWWRGIHCAISQDVLAITHWECSKLNCLFHFFHFCFVAWKISWCVLIETVTNWHVNNINNVIMKELKWSAALHGVKQFCHYQSPLKLR